jgi:hypothetical protein
VSVATPAAPVASRPATRTRVGTRDLVWVLYRRHRAAFWLSLAGTAALAAALLICWSQLDHLPKCVLPGGDGTGGVTPDNTAQFDAFNACTERWMSRAKVGSDVLLASAAAPVLFAMLVAGPMFAREFERGTYVLPATSGVRAGRWLRAQMLAVGGTGLVLAVVLAAAGMPLRNELVRGAGGGQLYTHWTWWMWETGWLLVPHVLIACSVGFLVSALLRRSIPALAVTAALAIGLQVVALQVIRPIWWTPERVFASIDGGADVGNDALLITSNVYANARGYAVSYPTDCQGNFDAEDGFTNCLRSHGITQRVSVFQPASRLTPFAWAEGGAFVVLSAGAVLGTARLMRRDPPA